MRRDFVCTATIVYGNITSGIVLSAVFRFIDGFFHNKPTVAAILSRRIRSVFQFQTIVFHITDFLSEQIWNDDIAKSVYTKIVAVKINLADFIFRLFQYHLKFIRKRFDNRRGNILGLLSVFQAEDNKICCVFVPHFANSIPIFKTRKFVFNIHCGNTRAYADFLNS